MKSELQKCILFYNKKFPFNLLHLSAIKGCIAKATNENYI
jgi:hypothetical protein